MQLRCFWLGTLLGFVLSSMPGLARASCPLPDSDEEVQARLARIEDIFRRREPDMRLWTGGFAAGHAIMGAASVGLAYAEPLEEGPRANLLIGAIGSGLGLATLVLAYPPLLGATRDLQEQPGSTPEALRLKLRVAQDRLQKSAQGVRFVRGWLARALSGAYSIGTTLLLWLAYDQPQGAALQLLGGAVIGQGRISLHPDGVADDWDAYQRDAGCPGAPALSVSAEDPVDWYVGGVPGGLSVGFRF